jgi:hypothetical protein
MHEHSGDDVAADADDEAADDVAADADDEAADDEDDENASVSSVATSGGTNWLEQDPDLVYEPWDSDEDGEAFKLFSGRGALVTPWTATDFVNPPFSEPELETELESKLAPGLCS